MAGESILIVDDTPVNLKLTRILLINEGFKVTTAASAEEALDLLSCNHPEMILADIQLPGIDGLELTRRVKQSPETCDIAVVALTAFAMKGDEQRALEAGCDGYITKPIDTRSLGARIRELMDRHAKALGRAPGQRAGAASGASASISPEEMRTLRRRFLEEGQEATRQLLLSLDGQFNANDAAKKVHNWIGTGGLLGYLAISRLARQVEVPLLERPVENVALREALTNLAVAFNSPIEAREVPLSEAIVQTLSGKRVALVGLTTSDAQALCLALERARAEPVFLEATEPPDSRTAQRCDLAVVNADEDAATSVWLDLSRAVPGRRMVFVGGRDRLLALDPAVQALAAEFLMGAWQPEEALVRMSLALSQRASGGRVASASRACVLVADDDPAVLAMVRTTLENFGMECLTAADGPSALDLARSRRPSGAVLDVNMPGMDGYEILAAIRKDEIPMRILLLTARQQESDVLRGFRLGADDYVVKPFNPMELVARMKRLLER
jgi:two-component system, cell cycle response regulator DivK